MKVDLTGTVFGKLKVLGHVKVSEVGRRRWRCNCLYECGKTTLVEVNVLKAGKTKSCGCGQFLKGEDHPNYKHGNALRDNRSPEYSSWVKIKERCLDVNNISYERYGAKGITIAPEFVNNFTAFLDEVGNYPEDGKKYSIVLIG